MEVKAVRIVREVLEKCEDCATKVNWLAIEVKWGQGELFKKGEKGLGHFRDFVQKHPEVFSLDVHSNLIKLVINVDVEPQRRLQTTQPTQSRVELVPKAQAQGLAKRRPQPNKGTATKSAASGVNQQAVGGKVRAWPVWGGGRDKTTLVGGEGRSH